MSSTLGLPKCVSVRCYNGNFTKCISHVTGSGYCKLYSHGKVFYRHKLQDKRTFRLNISVHVERLKFYRRVETSLKHLKVSLKTYKDGLVKLESTLRVFTENSKEIQITLLC